MNGWNPLVNLGDVMTEFPYMPIYTDAIEGDTAHLPNAAFGAYHHLLYAMWRHGGWVAGDEVSLARICRVSIWSWRHSFGRLLEPFLIRNGTQVSQKRLLEVLHQSRSQYQKNKARTAAATKASQAKKRQKTNVKGKKVEDVTTTVTNNVTLTKPQRGFLPLQGKENPGANHSDSSTSSATNGKSDYTPALGALGLEGRAPSPASEAKPPGKPSDILSDDDIAAIKERLSWAH
jgi:uncharacterized protein YdaU (DUF1376 family)